MAELGGGTSPAGIDQSGMEVDTRPSLPYSMIPVHVCHLLFLILLMLRVDYQLLWPWLAVFSPMIAPDVAIVTFKIFEIYRGLHPTNETRPDQKELHSLLRLVCVLLDTGGVIGSKIYLAWGLQGLDGMRSNHNLSHKLLRPLLQLLSPLWIGTFLSALGRASLPRPSRLLNAPDGGRGYRISQVMLGVGHILFRALQPFLVALKVDGSFQASWFNVFTPAWIILLSFGLLATALFNCAPLFTMGANQRSEVYQRMKYLMILYSLQFYLFAITLFFFLYQLCRRLDCPNRGGSACGITATQIILPLILLYFLLLFLNPLVVRNSIQYQAFVRDMYAQIFDPSAAIHAESGENLLRPLDAPTWLYRQANNLYRRPSVTSLKKLQDTAFPVFIAPPLSIEDSSNQVVPLCNFPHGSLPPQSPASAQDIETGETQVQKPGEDKCCVCLTNPCDTVLMECGHAAVCFTCGQVVAKRKPGICPICRSPIIQVLKIEGVTSHPLGMINVAVAKEGFSVVQEQSPETADRNENKEEAVPIAQSTNFVSVNEFAGPRAQSSVSVDEFGGSVSTLESEFFRGSEHDVFEEKETSETNHTAFVVPAEEKYLPHTNHRQQRLGDASQEKLQRRPEIESCVHIIEPDSLKAQEKHCQPQHSSCILFHAPSMRNAPAGSIQNNSPALEVESTITTARSAYLG